MSDDTCEHWRWCEDCQPPGVANERDQLRADLARVTAERDEARTALEIVRESELESYSAYATAATRAEKAEAETAALRAVVEAARDVFAFEWGDESKGTLCFSATAGPWVRLRTALAALDAKEDR